MTQTLRPNARDRGTSRPSDIGARFDYVDYDPTPLLDRCDHLQDAIDRVDEYRGVALPLSLIGASSDFFRFIAIGRTTSAQSPEEALLQAIIGEQRSQVAVIAEAELSAEAAVEYALDRGPDTPAAQVVSELVGRTALPLDAVLKAAEISKSTYHYWVRHPDTRPRLASVGRLWELAQLVDDIESMTGNARWLRTSSRRDALVAGHFDALFVEARTEVAGLPLVAEWGRLSPGENLAHDVPGD